MDPPPHPTLIARLHVVLLVKNKNPRGITKEEHGIYYIFEWDRQLYRFSLLLLGAWLVLLKIH